MKSSRCFGDPLEGFTWQPAWIIECATSSHCSRFHQSLTLDLFVDAKLLYGLRLTHPNVCKCEYGHSTQNPELGKKQQNPDILIINICTPGLQSPLMCPDISPPQKYVAYLPSSCQTNLHFHSSNEQMIVAECVRADLSVRVCVCLWVGGVFAIC